MQCSRRQIIAVFFELSVNFLHRRIKSFAGDEKFLVNFSREPVTQRRGIFQRLPVLAIQLRDVAETGGGVGFKKVKFIRFRILNFFGKFFPVVFAVALR